MSGHPVCRKSLFMPWTNFESFVWGHNLLSKRMLGCCQHAYTSNVQSTYYIFKLYRTHLRMHKISIDTLGPAVALKRLYKLMKHKQSLQFEPLNEDQTSHQFQVSHLWWIVKCLYLALKPCRQARQLKASQRSLNSISLSERDSELLDSTSILAQFTYHLPNTCHILNTLPNVTNRWCHRCKPLWDRKSVV